MPAPAEPCVMHEKNMKKLFLSVGILVLFIAQPVFGMELREIKSSDQLARFILSRGGGWKWPGHAGSRRVAGARKVVQSSL